MASSYSNPESLVELSTLVERTLVDTGRLFRKSGSMPSRTNLQRALPSYSDSFQEALDNLSEQIFIAKAFLEKDYEAIKARQAAPPAQDVAMGEVPQEVEPEAQPQPTGIDLDSELQEAQPKTEEGTSGVSPTPIETMPKDSGDSVTVKEEKEPANAEPGFPGTTDEINFDSVLNDSGGPNSFDLDLDFGNDDMGNQAFLSGSSFGNTGMGGTDKPSVSQPPDSSAHATGGGAFDMELQRTEGGANQLPGQDSAMEDIMGPGESSFDDLFMETENLGGNGTGDLNQLEGDSLMNISELDDNWFT
ncbi:hypothetical protein NUU61_006507 [Penicillium alfredii]|uniref:Uncharacterized protein n=1 Tax=Penicillium alfredii TaxID=1506179 RepID=A0A9W9K4B6_9EURO|nr:uncharacterized protein NUU61_006507 [Penicillium alfredii]KAJ5091637.1 hypothetical protein NUU61_006507 [Penicillium alfredii]